MFTEASSFSCNCCGAGEYRGMDGLSVLLPYQQTGASNAKVRRFSQSMHPCTMRQSLSAVSVLLATDEKNAGTLQYY